MCKHEAEGGRTRASLSQREGNRDAFACLHTDFSRPSCFLHKQNFIYKNAKYHCQQLTGQKLKKNKKKKKKTESVKHIQWDIQRNVLRRSVMYIYAFRNSSVCEHFCCWEREIYRTWRLSITPSCTLACRRCRSLAHRSREKPSHHRPNKARGKVESERRKEYTMRRTEERDRTPAAIILSF